MEVPESEASLVDQVQRVARGAALGQQWGVYDAEAGGPGGLAEDEEEELQSATSLEWAQGEASQRWRQQREAKGRRRGWSLWRWIAGIS